MINDKAVFTAASGYVFKAEPGTAAITPEQLRDFDPETFGAGTSALVITGSPDGGTYTVSVDGKASKPIAFDAEAADIQAAISDIEGVGAGNVVVKGTKDAGFTIALVGDLYGTDKEVTADGSGLTGGTSPSVEVTELSEALGWEPIGHTAAEELPEFGYEGGESESKGTWQKKNLKQVTTEAPVDYVTIKAQQFDPETLELYYGKNISKVKNVFGIDDPSKSGIDKALMIIMVDGDFKIAFAAAKSTISRDESITLAADEFSTLPLRATFVKHPGRHLFEWILPAEDA